MKTPPNNSDPRWEHLLQQARADVGPPADVAALLRAVRQAPVATREGWVAEFTALFASTRVIPTCLAGSGVFAVLASWQAWNCWQALPWAQLFSTASGGAP